MAFNASQPVHNSLQRLGIMDVGMDVSAAIGSDGKIVKMGMAMGVGFLQRSLHNQKIYVSGANLLFPLI